MTYREWLKAEAAKIDSDGCSVVTDFRVECCHQHDLEYYYARSARAAFLWSQTGDPNPWGKARPVTFEEANLGLRECYQHKSVLNKIRLGHLSPVGWMRWIGVSTPIGRRAWNKHRAREQKVKRAA